MIDQPASQAKLGNGVPTPTKRQPATSRRTVN
jgi:hypothetical protein